MIVPLFFIDSEGNPGEDCINLSPCIVVGVGCYETQRAINAVAMIDTGANGIFVDSGFIQRIGAAPIRGDTIHGATGAMATEVFNLAFRIPEMPELQSECFATPLRQNRRGYDVVLGRSVLSMFEFRLRLKRRELELLPLQSAPAIQA